MSETISGGTCSNCGGAVELQGLRPDEWRWLHVETGRVDCQFPEVDGGRYAQGKPSVTGGIFDDPPNPRPPWWRPFARRRWARQQEILNLLVIAWWDETHPQRPPVIAPGEVIPSGGSGQLAASPPYMEVGES